MKKIISLILSVLMICMTGISVSADIHSDEYTDMMNEELSNHEEFEGSYVEISIPLYAYHDITTSNLNYDEMTANARFRAAPLMKNGEAISEVHFVYQNGEWILCSGMENGSALYDAIQQNGTDILYVFGRGYQHIVRSDQTDTMYDLYAFSSDAQMLSTAEQPLSLSDFVLCASYANAQPVEEEVLGGGSITVNEENIKAAKEYWANQNTDTNYTVYIVIGGVILLAVGAVVLLFCRKKAKSFK